MFGRSLAETVRFETRRGGGYVPLIVQKCVDFIRANGKHTCMIRTSYVVHVRIHVPYVQVMLFGGFG